MSNVSHVWKGTKGKRDPTRGIGSLYWSAFSHVFATCLFDGWCKDISIRRLRRLLFFTKSAVHHT